MWSPRRAAAEQRSHRSRSNLGVRITTNPSTTTQNNNNNNNNSSTTTANVTTSHDTSDDVVSFEPFAVETSIKRHIDDMDDSSYDGPVDLDEIFQVCI